MHTIHKCMWVSLFISPQEKNNKEFLDILRKKVIRVCGGYSDRCFCSGVEYSTLFFNTCIKRILVVS